MLYNPNWKKPEVVSLAGLVAWLETQNPRTEYRYVDTNDCLLTRYLQANGYSRVSCWPTCFSHSEKSRFAFWRSRSHERRRLLLRYLRQRVTVCAAVTA